MSLKRQSTALMASAVGNEQLMEALNQIESLQKQLGDQKLDSWKRVN